MFSMIGGGGGWAIAAPLICIGGLMLLVPVAVILDTILLYTANNKKLALRRLKIFLPILLLEVAVVTWLSVTKFWTG